MNVNSNGSRICLFISTIACIALLRFSNLAAQSVDPAQPRIKVTEIAPNVLVFATRTGNVLASVGPDGALLLGTPSAESTEQVSKNPGEPYAIRLSLCRDLAPGSGSFRGRCGVATAGSVCRDP